MCQVFNIKENIKQFNLTDVPLKALKEDCQIFKQINITPGKNHRGFSLFLIKQELKKCWN